MSPKKGQSYKQLSNEELEKGSPADAVRNAIVGGVMAGTVAMGAGVAHKAKQVTEQYKAAQAQQMADLDGIENPAPKAPKAPKADAKKEDMEKAAAPSVPKPPSAPAIPKIPAPPAAPGVMKKGQSFASLKKEEMEKGNFKQNLIVGASIAASLAAAHQSETERMKMQNGMQVQAPIEHVTGQGDPHITQVTEESHAPMMAENKAAKVEGMRAKLNAVRSRKPAGK